MQASCKPRLSGVRRVAHPGTRELLDEVVEMVTRAPKVAAAAWFAMLSTGRKARLMANHVVERTPRPASEARNSWAFLADLSIDR